MAGPLAVPTFVSRPDDKYAALDVYAKKDSAVVNNIQDVLSNSAGSVRTMDLINSVRGGKAAGGLLSVKTSLKNNLLNGITKGALAEGKGMLDRLGVAGLNKVTSSLGPSLQGLISAKLSGNSYNMKSALVGIAGNLTKVGISSLPSLGNLSETLTKWTGAAGLKISDPNALGAFGSALITQGMKGGSAGVLTAIASQLNAGGVMKQVVSDVLPDVKKFANLGTLKELIDFSPAPLGSLDKDLLAGISKNLPVPEFPLTGVEYEEKFKTVKETYAAVEPAWNVHTHYVDIVLEDGSYKTKEESLFDVSKIAVSSAEFKKTVEIGALASDKKEDKLMLVATKLSSQETDVEKFARMYPEAAAAQPGRTFGDGYYEGGRAKSAGMDWLKSDSADPRSVALSQSAEKPNITVTTRSRQAIQKELDYWNKEMEKEAVIRVDSVEAAMDNFLKNGGIKSDLFYRGLAAKRDQEERLVYAKYNLQKDPLLAELRSAT